MERALKQNGESENSQRTAQARFTSKSREGELAQGIDNSPAMVAQRKKLHSLFGGAIQRVEDEEPLQGRFETAQRVEEEEPLQGKFDSTQRVEVEEPLQGKFETAQRVEEEEPLQGKFETAQRVEEEEPLQGKFEAASPVQRQEESAKPNNTGLPDNLKSGIENLSGMSMDNVKVHYNSSQPAQLNALAYAQGSDIHVAPGQEQHLPHEAWHVVQQAQGRVKPTMQMKEGVPVNDDRSLEHEADVMGAKALVSECGTLAQRAGNDFAGSTASLNSVTSTVQRFFTPDVIAGYIDAEAHWTQARNQVVAFDGALNGTGLAHNSNVKTALLNTNALLKSNKAKGTLAGEAFEPMQWAMTGVATARGPGGANGIDTINYSLGGFGGETDAREVKSALNRNSAFSVIDKAWSAVVADHVDLYYQGPLD